MTENRLIQRAAKERQKRKPTDSVKENLPEQNQQARDAAGKLLGVSGKTVDFATKVLREWKTKPPDGP